MRDLRFLSETELQHELTIIDLLIATVYGKQPADLGLDFLNKERSKVVDAIMERALKLTNE